MNGDKQKQTKSENVRLRIWDWIFVCSQAIVVTLVAVSSFQGRHIDISYYPIAGITVMVLFLVMPLFLVIVTPFFWNRLPSAGTGFFGRGDWDALRLYASVLS